MQWIPNGRKEGSQIKDHSLRTLKLPFAAHGMCGAFKYAPNMGFLNARLAYSVHTGLSQV